MACRKKNLSVHLVNFRRLRFTPNWEEDEVRAKVKKRTNFMSYYPFHSSRSLGLLPTLESGKLWGALKALVSVRVMYRTLVSDVTYLRLIVFASEEYLLSNLVQTEHALKLNVLWYQSKSEKHSINRISDINTRNKDHIRSLRNQSEAVFQLEPIRRYRYFRILNELPSTLVHARWLDN